MIPLSGWVTDRIGARPTFVGAIVVFTAASLLCAASSTLAELVAARALQGIGGALMVPVGRLVVLRSIDKQHMIRAVAYFTWPALIAPVIAPALGGFLTTYASWHWIFLINVPLGLIAAAVAFRVVSAPRDETGRPLDWLGFAGTACCLGSAVYMAALLGEPTVRWLQVVVLAGISAGSAILTVRHLPGVRNPLVRLDVLRLQTFRVAHAGGSTFRAAVNAMPFILPLLFEDRFGWSAVKAGTVVLFVFVGNLAIKPTTTPMLHRFGFRRVLNTATAAASLSIAACAFLSAATPIAITALVVMLGGVFRSIGFTAYNTIAFADVPPPAVNDANTLAATIQQFAQGLGIAVAVIALRIGDAVTGGTAAYRLAFVLIAALSAVAFLESLALPRTAGDVLRPVSR
jgi:MFS family permease